MVVNDQNAMRTPIISPLSDDSDDESGEEEQIETEPEVLGGLK